MDNARKIVPAAIVALGFLLVIVMVVQWLNNPAQQALDWMSEGNYDKAIEAFNRAIEKEPTNAELYCGRGVAWLTRPDRPDFERAVSDFNKAIELKPDMAEAFLNRAAIRIGNEDYDGALSDCDQAEKVDSCPELRAGVHVARGAVFSAKQEPAKAILELDNALELNPRLAATKSSAYSTRAVAYAKLQQFDKAMQDCEKAIQYDPRSAYKARGLVKLLQGKESEAEEDFQKHRENMPGFEADLRKAITRTRKYIEHRNSAKE